MSKRDADPVALLRGLLEEARSGARLAASPVHGERHWRAVAATALLLAEREREMDRAFFVAFAMVHDCRRDDEHADLGHGARAADFLASSRCARLLFAADSRRRLARACKDHDHVPHIRDDVGIGICLDADRFTLGRAGVGLVPDRRFFSRPWSLADFDALCAEGRRLSAAPPSWETIFERLTGEGSEHASTR